MGAHVEGNPYTTDLLAGQHTDVGDVEVWNDGDNLYVTYKITEPDWVITETHLYVGKNNPEDLTTAPGQFPYDDDDADSVTDTEVTYVIPLDDIDNYSMQENKKGKPTGKMVADGETGVDPCEDIYIAAHAVVVNVITEAPYYAASVDDYLQGTLNTGNPIPASWDRSNPAAVLALNEPLWFFSLGFGESNNGWIIVEFDCPIRNGDGSDVQILEVTNASPYPSETADVSASQDGSTWFLLGIADNINQAYPVGLTASEFDLGSLPWAKYIKVEDTTDPAAHVGIVSDAFDLEAVVSLQDCIQEETAWGDGEDFEHPNWAMYFTYHVQGDCNLVGNWDHQAVFGSTTYYHDMTITTQDSGGAFSGTGGFPAGGSYSINWTVSGTVSNGNVVLNITYPSGYWAVNTGTIAPDCNSMSGTWIDSNGKTGTWSDTRLP